MFIGSTNAMEAIKWLIEKWSAREETESGRPIQWGAEVLHQSVIKGKWSRSYWNDSFGHVHQRVPPDQSVVLERRRSSLEWPTHSVMIMKTATKSVGDAGRKENDSRMTIHSVISEKRISRCCAGTRKLAPMASRRGHHRIIRWDHWFSRWDAELGLWVAKG